MSYPAVYTGLSWTPSPRQPAEAKPNLSQLYLNWLSLAKPAKLNFFKFPPLVSTISEYQKVSTRSTGLRRICVLLILGVGSFSKGVKRNVYFIIIMLSK